MKRILFSISIIAGLLLSACDNSNGRKISDYSEMSTGDSLLYYYIQLRAHEYWEKAVSDTSLRSRDSRDSYLEGVEKGFDLVKDDDNFNLGLRNGVRMAVRLREFEQKYHIKLNEDIVLESLRNGLADERNLTPMDDQKQFYRLLDKMKRELRAVQKESAMKTLEAEAKKRGLEKLEENLYFKVLREGEGRKAVTGDVITVSSGYERVDGENLGLPTPVTVTLGDNLPAVVNRAYSELSSGASAEFAATAQDLFGSRTSQMGLADDDVVIFYFILNQIE